MKTKRFVALVVAIALVATAAATVFAAGLGYNKVVAQSVYVRKSPQGLQIGTLITGDHFNAQYISPEGWAWGWAYGNAKKCGWVPVGSPSDPYLVTSNDSHGTPPDCGPHHNIP